MLTDHQYTVPTSGNPIRGLIQDSVVSGVLLTSTNMFLSKALYQQVLLKISLKMILI